MNIFISHISKEANIAKVLKEWIETSFVGECDVFVSSDKADIPAGSKWLDEIDTALESAKALIVLCSRKSLTRPWINFEMGCGWIKRVPVIPICHTDQKKGELPFPISMFQALEIEDANFVDDLMSSLADHLGFSKTPKIDKESMKSELIKACMQIKVNSYPAEAEPPKDEQSYDIPEECVTILVALSKIKGDNRTSDQLGSAFKMAEERMKYFLDLLLEHEMLYRQMSMGSPTTFSLNKNGRKFLYNNNLL